MKTLIVYYSRTGFTRTVADELADRCKADVVEIHDVRPRSGVLGYLRSAREALNGTEADIKPPKKNAADYDLVVLGTPVWAGRVSSPVRAYVARYRQSLQHVALFVTQGGSGGTKVLEELAGLCGVEPVATFVASDADIKSSRYVDGLEGFAAACRQPALARA